MPLCQETPIITSTEASRRVCHDPTKLHFRIAQGCQLANQCGSAFEIFEVLLTQYIGTTAESNPTATPAMNRPAIIIAMLAALARCGGEEDCLRLIHDYWVDMVKVSAHTFWEYFDPEDLRKSPYGDCHNNSYCHAWSCTPSCLLRGSLKKYLADPIHIRS